MSEALTSVSALTARLQDLHEHTGQTPLFNPVFQLSLDLSRQLEAGELSLAQCEAMIAELEVAALQNRCVRMSSFVAPVAQDENTKALQASFDSPTFAAFKERWERPQLHAVFTAHPTFLLSPKQTAALADCASGAGTIDATCVGEPRPQVTLAYEHDRAMFAIANAQDARDKVVATLLGHAAQQWPGDWHDLAPLPFRFATWVGYDMDGRTDITWSNSIGFRLAEKAERLARYVAQLEGIDAKHPLLSELVPARDYAAERAQDFAADLSEPAALSVAANRLTASDPRKLLSLKGMIAQLEAEARAADHDRAIALKTLAAAMRADGLGMGWIHFRVNAKQLHNAIRRRVDPEGRIDLASKGAMVHLRKAIAEVKPLRSNFGALAIEASTATRQFLAMAQILAHIDADAPIRMLIAECEEPATVLAAVYFAKLFGIADKVDCSPLFETETALEHGGRFLDELLAEPEYQDYVRKRGRVSIQAGFSDAGRFVGQLPASLAIERLQGRLAEAMDANGLTDVSALIFNTHGESMGRGAHPTKMADRLDWALSPWAKRRFVRAGIALEPEVSFQGGDGYLWFATPELALAMLTRIAVLRPNDTDADVAPDEFYRRTDLSLDFYRAIKEHQRDHLESRTYSRAITAFGLGLLNSTGSRVSRRQSDLNADRDMSLRQIRAIPHNSILQQLGYPVNVIAGVGEAAEGNYEEIAALLRESPRGRELIRLVRAANGLASVKTVAAFGELFNSAYWASRPYRGTETHLTDACEALSEYLVKDDRAGVFRRLASRLRVDAMKLHRLLALIPEEDPDPAREEKRRMIGAAQALRLALLQHMFLRAVSVPVFSRANDVSRDDVLEMVFTLRVDEALAQLRRAYPVSFPQIDQFNLTEPTDWPENTDHGYEAIHRNFIEPIDAAHSLSLRITTVIANVFGAHG
ncbi:phosphoenolpyruvate carboxylase [Aurantiacibacter xanthus]|uniref:Phosphoenolpyruvate carboxylase n=1 Tax=Aurantiacibacter xanthus TaxID=1784712 RepID=A0A3A1P150_9SPHN|nr:phosphoenolpyruvate carboxylase [Aurantiacibacter xanthus]RIV80458.1 phosphoenolpyruvate carboxylase [Aurantiacibacter xanthus]